MAKRGERRERILDTALALFNAEGEACVSTVDIAAVMGISPGNLYYHFKGKEAIIEALYDGFEAEMRLVLSTPIKRPLEIEDNWVFAYIVFEEIHDFRFFYEGLASILERCPGLRPRVARLVAEKRATALSIVDALAKRGAVALSAAERAALGDQMAAHFTFFLAYRSLVAQDEAARARIAAGAHSLLMMIAPLLAADRAAYARALDAALAAARGRKAIPAA